MRILVLVFAAMAAIAARAEEPLSAAAHFSLTDGSTAELVLEESTDPANACGKSVRLRSTAAADSQFGFAGSTRNLFLARKS